MSDQFFDKRKRPIYLHSDVDDMTHLDSDTMRVYMHLARRANNDAGKAWPSYQAIGNHCFAADYKHPDTRRKAAMRAVANLIRAGLLGKEQRSDPVKGDLTNVYSLLDPPPGINGSPPQGSMDHPPRDQYAPPPVIHRSPKDTPIEDTPIEEKREIVEPEAPRPAPPQPYADTAIVPEPEAKPRPKAKAEKPPPLTEHPLIDAYYQLHEKYPSKAQMKLIIESNPPFADWVRAIRKWASKGYKPTDFDGMLEWANDPKRMERNGPGKSPANGRGYAADPAPNHDEAAIEAAREWYEKSYPDRKT